MTDLEHNIAARLRGEALDELQGNILPYWMDRMIDPRGGFYGRRDGNGQRDGAG